MRLSSLLFAAVYLQCVAAARAQCNHTSRTVAVPAGDHNFSTAPCVGFTVKVGGQTVSGLAECTGGGARYAGIVYVCGGAANDVDCDSHADKVEITIFSDGGCADLTGLLPGMSFDSWAQVPAAVRNGLKCVPPKKKTTFDWSAATTSCPTGQKHQLAVGEIQQSADGSYYIVAQGQQYAVNGTIDPFATNYEQAQATTPAGVQGILGTLIVPLHERIAGVSLVGTVSFEHHLGGEVDARTVSIVGRVLANGRFDLQSTCSVMAEGGVQPYGRWITFDGNALSIVCDDSVNGNVWDATQIGFGARLSREVPEVWPLRDWVRDPFDIPWFRDVQYSEIPQGTTTLVRRAFDRAVAKGVDTEWEIDTRAPAAHPLIMRSFDPVGLVRSETKYEDYRTLQPGLWRPFKMTRTSWLDPSQGDDRVIVTVRLTEARLLTEADRAATPRTCTDSQIWFHWL